MKTALIAAFISIFSLPLFAQALASDDFGAFDSIELKGATTEQILQSCPPGPYPVQPVGPIAGTIKYKTLDLSAGSGTHFTNVTATVWRYPCSKDVSVPVVTIDPHGGQIVVDGNIFTLKETESPREAHRVLSTSCGGYLDYRYGTFSSLLNVKKSFPLNSCGLDFPSVQNFNKALIFSLELYLNPTGGVETHSINIPVYRASDYFPETPVTPPPSQAGPTRNHTGQWGSVGENGWGLTVIQGFTSNARYVFAPWYTYDKTGKNAWYLFQGDTWTASDVFSADVYSYSGPPFGPTYNESQFSGNSNKVGTAKLTFHSATSARFEYTVDGISRSINLYKLE
ncbi:MAG: hypothetical protein FWC38_06570 [Proteobacteria bacterium]|nr:hypothetical protein [Pseudomonadota bacterium]